VTILLYSPFDQRSRDTESLMIAFQRQGHTVLSLSQSTGAGIHPVLEMHGIKTFSYIIRSRSAFLYYLKHTLFLIRFCRRHTVDIIYAHLESANFVAILAQPFIRGRVLVTRHHTNEAALRRFDRSLSYRLTYRLAKTVIVVSETARSYMIEKEHVASGKIVHIDLGYDFGLFAPADPEKSKSIRNSMKTQLVLLSACRITRPKRPEKSIETLAKLRARGIDASLIFLGRGEEESKLRELIAMNNLVPFVSMPGHVSNVSDYLAAADFLVHPSVAESSCVIVKEAALLKVPVIVCRNVGDFDEYMVNMKNGFVLDKDDFSSAAADVIDLYRNDRQQLNNVASQLFSEVISRFDIARALPLYDKLNRN
jgi:glycosyltransferase involved in cell wall biosynthesis